MFKQMLIEEETDIKQRKGLLKLQQLLDDHLPDGWAPKLTNVFSDNTDYHYGSWALRIRHPSYEATVWQGEVLLFVESARNNLVDDDVLLVFTPKGHPRRTVHYSLNRSTSIEEFVKDLVTGVPQNSF